MRVAKSTLLACSLALLLVLAGCNGQGGSGAAGTPTFPAGSVTPGETTPTEAPTETPSPTPSAVDLASEPQTGALIAEARSRGISVESFDTRNDTVVVRYYANSTEDAVRRGVILSSAYTSVVNETWQTDATWNATRMDAVAVRTDGTPLTRYRMMAYWGAQIGVEYYDTDELTRRIDASFATARNGQFPPASGNLLAFGTTIDRTPDVNLTALFQRGETVYVTIENRTANHTQYRNRIQNVVQIYGAFLNQSFEPRVVELEVRDENGDVEGWYRIDRRRALNYYLTENPTVFALIADTYWAESDNFDG
jgi:hypothetical protein